MNQMKEGSESEMQSDGEGGESEMDEDIEENLIEEISNEEIHTQLKLFPMENNKVRAVWDLDIYQKDQKHWWSLRVDAQTG